MKVQLEPGLYVVAVSGGVDSMVLLDVLRQQGQLRLVVAHYDHGIRPDSVHDRQLVQSAAEQYGLQFVYDRGHLGADASEAQARTARYDFLHRVRHATKAQAIVTAHHQDDVLETAIINMIRGTGRRGLSSLQNREQIARPLLDYEKGELVTYAQANGLQWREDSTNQDEKYLRNYVRKRLLNALSKEQKAMLLERIRTSRKLNQEIDSLLMAELHQQPSINTLDRKWFNNLSYAVSCEVMVSWLRARQLPFDAQTVQRLVVAAKTLPAGKTVDVSQGAYILVEKDCLALKGSDR